MNLSKTVFISSIVGASLTVAAGSPAFEVMASGSAFPEELIGQSVVELVSARPASAARAKESFNIVWVGDVLLGDAAQPDLDRHGYTWPFAHVRDLLGGDYLIGNQEGPITDLTKPYFPHQEYSYNARPPAAAALAKLGFDAMDLSNNHALDRGAEGLADTRRYLAAAGVVSFGAGTKPDAESPLLVETPGGIVAVLGFGSAWNYGAAATTADAGTLDLSRANVERGYALATKTGARWVVAYVHWGENYEDIQPTQRKAAALLAEAGYDLIIGAHPHVVQPVEFVAGVPVLYSLGNFTFGTPGRFTHDQPGYGLVVRTSFGRGHTPVIELSCIVTDNDTVRFQPRPCAPAEARRYTLMEESATSKSSRSRPRWPYRPSETDTWPAVKRVIIKK